MTIPKSITLIYINT